MFHITYVSFNLFWTVFWSFKEGKLEKQLIHNVWMMYTVFFIKSCVSMYENFFEPLLYYKFTSIWTWYIYQHLCVCFSYFSCKDMCKQKYIPDNQQFFYHQWLLTMKYCKRTQQLSCDIFVEQKWWSIIEFTQLAIIVQIFQYNHQSIIMNKWLYKNLHYILTCPWKESLKFYL